MIRVLCLVLLIGCAPSSVIWSGRTADRMHKIEVVSEGGYDYVAVDGMRRGAHRGIAGWSVALAKDHIAYAARSGKRWIVVMDGKPSEVWDGIAEIRLSESGRLAYLAERDRRWFVVVDGRPGQSFEGILANTLTWSRDGGHYAYVGSTGTTLHAIVDGVAGPPFQGIANLTLSDDGRRHAYSARHALDTYVVIDGVTGTRWSAVGQLVVTPMRVAYAASDGTTWRVVVDGENGPAVDRVYRIVVAGSRVAWVGRLGEVDVLALDHTPIASRAKLRADGVALSRAGLAYIDSVDGKERVVVDGTPGPDFDEVGNPVWSADGRIAYTARRGTARFVVVDGRELPGGQIVGNPVFSDDGKRLAYAVRRNRMWFVREGDREYAFDLVLPDSLVFSGDGKRWAVIAGDLRREQLFIVVEGNRRVPIDSREIYSAAAWKNHDATAVILAWVRAEADR